MPEASGKKLCFVVSPIGDEGTPIRIHADWLLDGIIAPVLASYPEFQVRRADKDKRPGLIDVQMINDLLDAELVIADLSFYNPNAFYEIGIRHMAQKPIIHMQLATEKAPFDVNLFRAIKFSCLQFSDLEKAKDELKHQVNAVLADGYQVTNPVTNARGYLELEKTATPETRVLLEEIEGLKSRLDSMLNHLSLLTQPTNLSSPSALPTLGNYLNERLILGNNQLSPAAGTAIGEAISSPGLGISANTPNLGLGGMVKNLGPAQGLGMPAAKGKVEAGGIGTTPPVRPSKKSK